MKYLTMGAVLFLILLLAVFAVLTKRKNAKIAKAIQRVIISSIITTFTVFLFLLFTQKEHCLWIYSLYFAATDWLLYYLLKYVVEFIGEDVKRFIVDKYMIPLLLADSCFLLSNVFTQAVFCVSWKRIAEGFEYYAFEPEPLFIVHGIFVYFLAISSLIALLYKFKISPRIYRYHYLSIALVILGVLLVNAYSMFIGDGIDVSVFGYALAGVIIYYASLCYMPKALVQGTMGIVVDDMADALMIMDEENRCIYANHYAEEFFGGCIGKKAAECDLLPDLFSVQHLDGLENKIQNRACTIHGQKHYLKIQFRRLEDEKGRYLGCFFMAHNLTKERENYQREKYKATHDSLTGLYNREYFYEEVHKCLEKHPKEQYLMICSDIGRFKLVNDLFGVKMGDALLIRIARAIEKEAKEGAVYGRIANDRFGLVMPKSRFRESLFLDETKGLAYIDENETYPLIVYIGVYEIIDRGMSVAGMYDRAYMALDSIKGDYYKRVAYYNDDMLQTVLKEQELVGELDRGIEEGEIRIYLQPQVSGTGTVLGAEALVRWIHPLKGTVPPFEFIPIYEKSGMIAKLDQHIWRLACERLKRWKEMGREDMHISVNISPKDLYFVDIYQTFVDLVKEYDISPKNLKLEITETAFIHDVKQQRDLIERLQEAGFDVEMDDFGSGYSSLNMLNDIPVDVIKLDMAFLRKSDHEQRSREIMEMIIQLSKRLGMDVISEGVETEEQLRFLKNIGCDTFQGYYFSKPIAADDFEKQYMQ